MYINQGYHQIAQGTAMPPMCANCEKVMKRGKLNMPIQQESVFIMINNDIDDNNVDEVHIAKDLNDFVDILRSDLSDDNIIDELTGEPDEYTFYKAVKISVKPKTESVEQLIGIETEE